MEMLEKSDPFDKLFGLINGYQVSQSIGVVVKLRVADLLSGGPRSAEDLAAITHADPDVLYRVLRLLAAVGVFREAVGQVFHLTELGAILRSDSTDSLADFVNMITPDRWRAWGDLIHSVKTGEGAFEHTIGESLFQRNSRVKQDNDSFNKGMHSRGGIQDELLLDAYDFGKPGITVMDVGGGQGSFLVSILQRNPLTKGILFDQPWVVDGAAELIQAANVGDRCHAIAGDFFESVPKGADVYILKLVIHNWNDEKTSMILRKCREAVPDDGKLLIITADMGEANTNPGPKFMDLNMQVVFGSKERTVLEHEALFEATGFRLGRVVPVQIRPIGMLIIEGIPT